MEAQKRRGRCRCGSLVRAAQMTAESCLTATAGIATPKNPVASRTVRRQSGGAALAHLAVHLLVPLDWMRSFVWGQSHRGVSSPGAIMDQRPRSYRSTSFNSCPDSVSVRLLRWLSTVGLSVVPLKQIDATRRDESLIPESWKQWSYAMKLVLLFLMWSRNIGAGKHHLTSLGWHCVQT